MSFDFNAYKKQYNKDNYTELKIRIPKGKRHIIDDLSERTGKSINRIFIEAVERHYHVNLTFDLDKLFHEEEK